MTVPTRRLLDYQHYLVITSLYTLRRALPGRAPGEEEEEEKEEKEEEEEEKEEEELKK